MQFTALLVLIIGVLVPFGAELGCSVEFDRLMLPKKAADGYRINTVKVSYSFILPESLCVDLDKQAKAQKKVIEPDGCLNGLGYIGTIQIRRDSIRAGDFDEIILGCDEFKLGTFNLGKYWYGFPLPRNTVDELNKMERDSEAFHEMSIDSTYYYKKIKD